MIDIKYSIKGQNGAKISVTVRRDQRLKKSSRWERKPNGTIQLRIPARLPKKHIKGLLEQIEVHFKKQNKTAKRRTDTDLKKRADHVNKKYFQGLITWKAIRWVGNMNTRLGSCTNGGPTDGHIRISDKIKDWPQWVIDSIIAHELVHRLHNNHSQAFWATLKEGYPLTERARGFTMGLGFAEGITYEDD